MTWYRTTFRHIHEDMGRRAPAYVRRAGMTDKCEVIMPLAKLTLERWHAHAMFDQRGAQAVSEELEAKLSCAWVDPSRQMYADLF